MFRATSEMAVAISVASVGEKPISVASSRPRWRARTRSVSDSMITRISPDAAIRLPPSDEQSQALFQVQGRVHSLQAEPQLDDGERHLGPDPDDDRVGPAKLRGDGDGVQRPGHERVDDVQAAHVQDDAPGPEPLDLLCHIVLSREAPA